MLTFKILARKYEGNANRQTRLCYITFGSCRCPSVTFVTLEEIRSTYELVEQQRTVVLF